MQQQQQQQQEQNGCGWVSMLTCRCEKKSKSDDVHTPENILPPPPFPVQMNSYTNSEGTVLVLVRTCGRLSFVRL